MDTGDYGAIIRSIVAAFRYRPTEMRIELDGDRTIQERVVLIAVANGPYMGPGVPVAPDARLDDGLYDVGVFLPFAMGELLRNATSAALGRRAYQRRSLTERSSRARITSRRPVPVRADAQDFGNDARRLRDPTERPHGRRPGPRITRRITTERAPHQDPSTGRWRARPCGAVRRRPAQRAGVCSAPLAMATTPRGSGCGGRRSIH